MHRTFAWLAYGPVRLTLLLGLLMTLAVYGLATRTGAFGLASGAVSRSPCPVQAAPSVEDVSRPALRGLREDLRGVMFGRDRRLYELGLAAPSVAWSDGEPGRQALLPAASIDPGGYELRWWAANGDDVVLDGFIFAGADQARVFLGLAASARCRASARTYDTSSPPEGRDLQWRNPDGLLQEDVYLQRDQRVYRVAVVQPGARADPSAATTSAAFSLVNDLACALPGADCLAGEETVLKRTPANADAKL